VYRDQNSAKRYIAFVIKTVSPLSAYDIVVGWFENCLVAHPFSNDVVCNGGLAVLAMMMGVWFVLQLRSNGLD